MTLTAAQRAEINRRNSTHSTGPKTPSGRDKARRNALKHGLRADTLALPNEDPELVAERYRVWNDYYKPQSPAAHHLLDECVQATFLSQRCHRFHHASLTDQVRRAESDWDCARQDQVEAQAALLATDPALAVRLLTRTAEGCRWLIERWEHLDQMFNERGFWLKPERDEAIRLQGLPDDPDALKGCPEAFLTRFYNLFSQASSAAEAVEWLFESRRLPDACRPLARPEARPDRAACQAALRGLVAERLALLRALESELRESIDGPERAAAAERALILRDEKEARLFLRYHAEARTAFNRAHSQLLKALAEAPSAAPAAVSPNEPNGTGAEAVKPDDPKSSEEDSAPSGPATVGEAVPSGAGIEANRLVDVDPMTRVGTGVPSGADIGSPLGSSEAA
jgi:hypothetical protein